MDQIVFMSCQERTPLTYRENRLPSPQIALYNKDCNLLYEILCNLSIPTNLPKKPGQRSPLGTELK